MCQESAPVLASVAILTISATEYDDTSSGSDLAQDGRATVVFLKSIYNFRITRLRLDLAIGYINVSLLLLLLP